jgi:glycosyltransferase involved in cell wall biosynthesis
MGRPKILFLATEGWFIKSHFLALVKRAVKDGFQVVVAARMGDCADTLEQTGARVVDVPIARGDNSVLTLWRARALVSSLLAREQPDIVHVFALKPILLASLSWRAAPAAKQFLAFTGLGFLATSHSLPAVLARNVLANLISRRVRRGAARLVVENEDDRAWLERLGDFPAGSVTLLPGAGVEPDLYRPAPEPSGPLRIGLVARLVQSKGVDVAVAALALLRQSIPDAQLWIAGEPDQENPARYPDAQVEAWRKQPGIVMVGRTEDVPGFWAQAHVACLPSRGGEGLPRSLIEASACGRPVVTTAVSGCRDFVVYGRTGFVCPPNDPAALADAFAKLADGDLRRRMGEEGRKRVLEGYTTQHVADRVAQAWRDALADRK